MKQSGKWHGNGVNATQNTKQI